MSEDNVVQLPTPEQLLIRRVQELKAEMMSFGKQMQAEATRQAIATGSQPVQVSFNQAFHGWAVHQLALLTLSVEALNNAVNVIGSRL